MVKQVEASIVELEKTQSTRYFLYVIHLENVMYMKSIQQS